MKRLDRLENLYKSALRDPNHLAIDAVTESAIQELVLSVGEFLKLAKAAEKVLDEADPRRYEDLTESQIVLAAGLAYFHEEVGSS